MSRKVPASTDRYGGNLASRKEPLRMPITRRTVVRTAAASPLLLPALSWGRVLGANERLNMAVIGSGGMGTGHLRDLVNRSKDENLHVTRVSTGDDSTPLVSLHHFSRDS
jgi:hypothetical protein